MPGSLARSLFFLSFFSSRSEASLFKKIGSFSFLRMGSTINTAYPLGVLNGQPALSGILHIML